jgi:hypothetical protein
MLMRCRASLTGVSEGASYPHQRPDQCRVRTRGPTKWRRRYGQQTNSPTPLTCDLNWATEATGNEAFRQLGATPRNPLLLWTMLASRILKRSRMERAMRNVCSFLL